MKEKSKQIAQLMKILANEYRLLILCEIMKSPQTVGEIHQKITDISQSALSQHLALMKAHSIIDCTKSGQNVTYFIVDGKTQDIIKALKKYYCVGEM